MTAREHAEEAARAASDADLRASRLKDSGITFAMQAAQAHALTAIALALTDGPRTAVRFDWDGKLGARSEREQS